MITRDYEITIAGPLPDMYAEQFASLTVQGAVGGYTTMVARSLDQAALHAILVRVGDLGFTLIGLRALDVGASR